MIAVEMNEYEQFHHRAIMEWGSSICKLYPYFKKRIEGRQTFGFAIPDYRAIEELSKMPQPIVEIGCGLAYWAGVTKANFPDVEIDCYDRAVPPWTGERGGYSFPNEPWHPVIRGTEESVLNKDYQTLLLIWPDYMKPTAYNSLMQFKGNFLVYVGEGQWGCTGDDAFHELLEEKWNNLWTYNIPQWDGIHDRMYIYQRKS